MIFCNYNCVITGKNFKNIHHLYPFRNIVNEVFDNLGLPIKSNVSDYTEIQFIKIKNELHRLHNYYGLGVCLIKPIHKLFHDTYGYTNNTCEQFLEFVNRFNNGEFNQWLNNNNLKLNINYKVINYIKSIQVNISLSA